MEYKDYYKILGVREDGERQGDQGRLPQSRAKHHPDVNQGNKKAEARFKEISEANEVLSDPASASATTSSARTGSATAPAAGAGPGGRGRRRARRLRDLGRTPGGFSDFFRTFFGGGGGAGSAAAGRLRRLGASAGEGSGCRRMPRREVDLTLDEVAEGHDARRSRLAGSKRQRRSR